MMPRSYNIMVMAVTLSAVLFVALVNIVVDPGAIYLTKYLTNSEFDLYASTLIATPHGMIARGWNERAVKMALAKIAGRYDCAAIGSSRFMYVSSHRRPSIVADYCADVVNLSASGGGFEDMVVMIYAMASEHQLPRRLLIGIDPWTLQFETDERWKLHEDVYRRALEAFRSDDAGLRESYWTKIVANLVNLDYLSASIALLRKKGAESIIQEHLKRLRSNKRVAKERLSPLVVAAFDYRRGGETNVMLPDGSLVPSRSYLEDPDRPLFDLGYKIWDERVPAVRRQASSWVDPSAVRLLKTMITYLKGVGVEVYLVLTPYNRNVWNDRSRPTVPAMEEVSAEVRRLGRALGIGVIGSYNPTDVGCEDNEFYDYTHALPSCMSKALAKRPR